MKKEQGLKKLALKPEVIEAAFEHCTTKEQCAGCPLLQLHYGRYSGYCKQTLNIEALKYIRILKDFNRTLAQRVEELEGGAV